MPYDMIGMYELNVDRLYFNSVIPCRTTCPQAIRGSFVGMSIGRKIIYILLMKDYAAPFLKWT